MGKKIKEIQGLFKSEEEKEGKMEVKGEDVPQAHVDSSNPNPNPQGVTVSNNPNAFLSTSHSKEEKSIIPTTPLPTSIN